MSADAVTISEVFGPTLQGEGPAAGQRAVFVRLGLCNLDCSWCDTPYTWDWSGKNGEPQNRGLLSRLPTEDVSREAHLLAGQTTREPVPSTLLVVSGGEPMIQWQAVGRLADLWEHGEVHVETNGTLQYADALDAVDLFVVSPKLQNSGIDYDRRINLAALRSLMATNRAVLKFVVATPADALEAAVLVGQLDWPADRVWLMPEGRTGADILARQRTVVELAVGYGFNASTRLHVLAFDDKRAV